MVFSFAGGKSDPSDSDVVATALREAREELGVNVTTDSVWGILKPLRDWVSALVAVLTIICCFQLNVLNVFLESHLQSHFLQENAFDCFNYY